MGLPWRRSTRRSCGSSCEAYEAAHVRVRRRRRPLRDGGPSAATLRGQTATQRSEITWPRKRSLESLAVQLVWSTAASRAPYTRIRAVRSTIQATAVSWRGFLCPCGLPPKYLSLWHLGSRSTVPGPTPTRHGRHPAVFTPASRRHFTSAFATMTAFSDQGLARPAWAAGPRPAGTMLAYPSRRVSFPRANRQSALAPHQPSVLAAELIS